MKKQFIFLNLPFFFLFCLIHNHLYAQKETFEAQFMSADNISLTQECSSISLSFIPYNSSMYMLTNYLITYRTACEDSFGNITNLGDWVEIETTQTTDIILEPTWEISDPDNTSSCGSAQLTIPASCEKPIIFFNIYRTTLSDNIGLYSVKAEVPCLYTLCEPAELVIEVLDINIDPTCLLNPEACGGPSVTGGNKTSSTAYSPKDIALSTKPNPFSAQTTLEYSLTKEATVSLQVFDLQGRTVAQLIDHQKQAAGKQQQIWNAQHLPSGVYYYQLNVDGYTQTKKLVKF